MQLTLLGTGGAWPDADRSAPAFLFENDGQNFLIDCGGGTAHQLMKANIKPAILKNILFTHMHIDHCVEFPSLVFGGYLTGKEGAYNVYGPKGTAHFTTSIFEQTYSFAVPMMKKLRNKDIDINTKEISEGVFFEENGLQISCIPVEHGMPSLAYRFQSAEKSIVLSGDTAPCDNIIKIASNADIFCVECSFPEDSGPKPGHCIPSEVGKIAQEAKAKKVVLVHLFPPCKGKEDSIIADVKKHYNGVVEIGYDLQRVVA